MHDRPHWWTQFRDSTRKLRFKTTLLLLAAVVLSTAVSGVLYLNIAHRQMERLTVGRIRSVAQSLAVSSAHMIKEGDQAGLLSIAEQLQPDDEFRYVAFADPAGKVLAGAQHDAGYLGLLLYDDGRTIPVAPLDHAINVVTPDGESRMDMTFPVFDMNSVVGPEFTPSVLGFVRIGYSNAGLQARFNQLTRQVIGVGALIGLLMIPVGYAAVRQLVAPLNRLASVVRRFAAGEFGLRARINRTDEIGDLATAFDTMAGELESSNRKLLDHQAELEDRVAARTFQLTEVNRRLQEEIAEKEDFLRTVTHDLSAPLRNISGMVSMLRDRHVRDLSDQAGNLLSRIDSNAKHDLELIDELLELTRIRTRRNAAQQIDLDIELRSLIGRFDYELGEKNITIEIANALPTIHADRMRIHQLWQNLIDNSIKYTDPQRFNDSDRAPYIRISSDDRGNHFLFKVADNGIGVNARDRERIFYVFRRAKDGYVAGTTGKGVGLASCKSIVQNYNGRIWVEDNPEGGSVFCFTLAKDRVAPPAAAAPNIDTRALEAASVQS